MDNDDLETRIERMLSPVMDAALQHVQAGAVDGMRLGIGLCARAVDDFIERVPTFTAPEHVDAVVVVLRAVAATMREQSARFSLDE
jgi:hypothetical protein